MVLVEEGLYVRFAGPGILTSLSKVLLQQLHSMEDKTFGTMSRSLLYYRVAQCRRQSSPVTQHGGVLPKKLVTSHQ